MAIFTRLTFNENDWIIPSGHPWTVVNQGKPNIPYENQHGFGHEEWLLNPRYNVDGWQYGYIRGLKSSQGTVDRVYLYTVKKEEGYNTVYYLGFINNVETIGNTWRSMFPIIASVFDDYIPSVIEEVEQTNGNAQILIDDPFNPVIRFRIEDINILDIPKVIEGFPLARYKRFQPYHITDEILNLFENEITLVQQDTFTFNSGKASQTERFNRYVNASSKSVIKTHSKIVDHLENYLKKEYSLIRKNLSIESTRFSGNIGDVVTLEPDQSISIYEIKTTLNLRKNIREAVAQLLDYSSHCNGRKINKLIIVSPCFLDEKGERFIESLNAVIRHKIYYMQYLENELPAFIVNQ
jgi:hypothetical protein